MTQEKDGADAGKLFEKLRKSGYVCPALSEVISAEATVNSSKRKSICHCV